MNKEEIRLTIESRSKWEKIWKKDGVDKGTDNCALCEKYFDQPMNSSCLNCPVFKKTEWLFCLETPYYEWINHLEYDHKVRKIYNRGRFKNCKECTKIAKNETKFIDSLLPKKLRKYGQ